MKEFGKKHEYKLYLGASVISALLLVAISFVFFSSASTVSDGKGATTTNTELVAEVANMVSASDIHFQKEKQGIYDAYSPEKIALAKEYKVVLFFKADWCPSCVIADQTLNKEFASIPKDIAILKVSYDTELQLRKKYGVTVQHTFVQVDEKGNLITKWTGGATIGGILNKIK
jgi:thiol-disulfide isomerase/thioredoxin